MCRPRSAPLETGAKVVAQQSLRRFESSSRVLDCQRNAECSLWAIQRSHHGKNRHDVTHRGTPPKSVDRRDPGEAFDMAEVSRRQLRRDAELLLPIRQKSAYYEGAGHVKLFRSCVPLREQPNSSIVP